MTNDWPVFILPLVNYIVYWPIIGNLYFMTSFLIRPYKLLQGIFMRIKISKIKTYLNLLFINCNPVTPQNFNLLTILNFIHKKGMAIILSTFFMSIMM